MIETTPPGSAADVAGRPARHGSAARRLGVSSAIIAGLALLTALISIFAPLTPEPSGFFSAPTPSPFSPARAPHASSPALALQLREAARTAYVNSLISKMTLDEEIGQMIMVGFSETQMDDALAYQFKQLHVGSAILYAFNITNADQVTQLDAAMQADAKIPLLIATDQEGGDVNRLAAVIGQTPSAATIGASGNPMQAQQRGVQDAQALAQLGINLNLAPVADVLMTTGGDVQGRAFGANPPVVTTMAGAYLTGLQQSGHVLGTLKHFPGLGDVPVDPHATLYTLDRSKADLERYDWAPYRALIATGQVHAIMSTHVILSAIDSTRPASLSQPVLTGVLRDELGFDGVIITDGIYMHALENYSLDQIALYAVQAGNDIICSTYSIESTELVETTLKNAVISGRLPKSRIDASVRRILLLKLLLGLMPSPNFDIPGTK